VEQTQIDYFGAQKERDIAKMQMEGVMQALKRRGIWEEVMQEVEGEASPEGVLEEYQNQVAELKKELAERT